MARDKKELKYQARQGEIEDINDLLTLLFHGGHIRDFVIDARIVLAFSDKQGIDKFCAYTKSHFIPKLMEDKMYLDIIKERIGTNPELLKLLKQGMANTFEALFHQPGFGSNLVTTVHRAIIARLVEKFGINHTNNYTLNEKNEFLQLVNNKELELFKDKPHQLRAFSNHWDGALRSVIESKTTYHHSTAGGEIAITAMVILALYLLYEMEMLSGSTGLKLFLPTLLAAIYVPPIVANVGTSLSQEEAIPKEITNLYNSFFKIDSITPFVLQSASSQQKTKPAPRPGLNISLTPLPVPGVTQTETENFTTSATKTRRKMVVDKSASPFWSPPDEKSQLTDLQKIQQGLAKLYPTQELQHIKIGYYQNRFILYDYRDKDLQDQITTLNQQYDGAVTKFIDKNEPGNFITTKEKLPKGQSILLKGKLLGVGGKGEIRLCATEKEALSIPGIGEVEMYRFTDVLQEHGVTQHLDKGRK